MLRQEDKTSPIRGSASKMMMMKTPASEFDTGVGVNLSDALTASAAMSQYELQVGEFVCLRNAKHKPGQPANRFNPRYWTVRVLAIGASGLVRVQWFVEIRIGSRLFRPTEKGILLWMKQSSPISRNLQTIMNSTVIEHLRGLYDTLTDCKAITTCIAVVVLFITANQR